MRPEEAVPRTGDVVVGIGGRVMEAMAGDPADWLAGAVKDGKESQHRERPRLQRQCPVGDRAMVADRRAEAADPGERERCAQHAPAGKGKQNKSDYRGKVDKDNPPQGEGVLRGRPPPRPLPWTLVALGASLCSYQDAASLSA